MADNSGNGSQHIFISLEHDSCLQKTVTIGFDGMDCKGSTIRQRTPYVELHCALFDCCGGTQGLMVEVRSTLERIQVVQFRRQWKRA